MNGIFQDPKHFVSVELVNPVRILQNCKIQELNKVIIRNPSAYLFKEIDGKCYIVLEGAGEFEVKETLESIAEKLSNFKKDFNKAFDEFIHNTTTESRHLMGY